MSDRHTSGEKAHTSDSCRVVKDEEGRAGFEVASAGHKHAVHPATPLHTHNEPGSGDCPASNVRAAHKSSLALVASACLLVGCAAGVMPPRGKHLTDAQCRDISALKTNASPTMAEHQSELAALRKAGYDPSPFWNDPYYPEDLQDAQRLVDYWFQTECVPAQSR